MPALLWLQWHTAFPYVLPALPFCLSQLQSGLELLVEEGHNNGHGHTLAAQQIEGADTKLWLPNTLQLTVVAVVVVCDRRPA
jgi:hypothetical protein